MDALKLLTRANKLPKKPRTATTQPVIPSNGATASSQPIFGEVAANKSEQNTSRKRKRSQSRPRESEELDFFGGGVASGGKASQQIEEAQENVQPSQNIDAETDVRSQNEGNRPSDADIKKALSSQKLKVTWLNPSTSGIKRRRKGQGSAKVKEIPADKTSLYPEPLDTFDSLRKRFAISSRLFANIKNEGYVLPTAVQCAALPVLLDPQVSLPTVGEVNRDADSRVNLLAVAPTGSGKTLAFLIPIVHAIEQQKIRHDTTAKGSSAIILAPTKELAAQIVNEGRKLCQLTKVRVALVKKGMQLTSKSNHSPTQTDEQNIETDATVVKADILVATPGVLSSICQEALEHGATTLLQIRHLVLDEADVLLDPLFRDQTLSVWNSLVSKDLRVSLWSATMGSNIEELTRTIINDHRTACMERIKSDVPEVPLIRLVVGLKDSALPNISHRLVYAASEQGKLLGLRQLLHPTTTSDESGPPLIPPFLVFTQTIERAAALHSELRYDIPAEAGGLSRVAVLHSELSDSIRDSIMTRFRKGEIWILITTDLLSRGVDFRGVNGVVNYDIPTSSAAYVHRVGRTGRAGREGGIAVTLYTKEDIPFLKPIANLVAIAEKQRNGILPQDGGNEGVQQWLLDALPTLSKKGKQELRRKGVESRTARGKEKNPKAARNARISTKAGYLRRQENKKQGAISGSKRRQAQAATESDNSGDEFTGFG